MSNAFDRFVEEQKKSPSFAYHYSHEGAIINTIIKLMDDNPGRPQPKFQVAYFIEEPLPQGKVKRTHYRGQPVGLISNSNCGTVQDAVWSVEDNQWSYSIYPWTGDRKNKLATEDVLMPIEEWLNISSKDMLIINLIKVNMDHLYKDPYQCLAMNIFTHYKSLISGRANNILLAKNNLRKLVDTYARLAI